MNAIENYIQTVLKNIHAPQAERERMRADLRAHIDEALAGGETPQAVLERMGSPLEVAAEFMAQTELNYAGFWIRTAAFAIDMALILPLAGLLAMGAIWLSDRVPSHPVGLDYLTGAALIGLVIGMGAATFGLVVVYFPLLEGRFGQTAGKRLLKLRVLTEDGLPVGYKEAFLRRLSLYFEFLPIDALFIPFNPKQQRAFDRIARTVVIREA